MAISDNIQAKAAAIFKEKQDFQAGRITSTPIANDVQTKAKAAILGGNKSPAWVDYMTLFKTTGTELARLIPTDGSNTLDETRAYLVSNGVCGMGTTDQIANNVDKKLDL